jgi:autotransporter-associated beta strand protein
MKNNFSNFLTINRTAVHGRLRLLGLVAACVVGSWSTSLGQTTILWGNTGATTAWYTNTNWSPSTTSGAWTTSSIAQFQNNGTATSASIAITTSNLSIGAIELTSARTRNLSIGNSTTTNGTLTLNGTTVNSVANTIIRHNSANNLTIQDNGGAAGLLGLALGNATENIVSVEAAGSVTFSSLLSGGKLTKSGSGAGSLILNATNTTFSGGVTLNAGTLQIKNVSCLGTGTFTINGGIIDQTVNAGPVNLGTVTPQTWGGDFTFLGSLATGSLNMGTGAVSLTGNRTVTVSANTLTIGGVISGGFGLTKAGAGTMTLTGTNTYTGLTTVNAGTLNLNKAGGALPATNNVTVASGGTLVVSANQTLNNLTVAAGGTVTVNAGVTLTINGTYSVSSNSSGNAGTILTNGTLQINEGGWPGNTGTFTYGASGTLVFANTTGPYGISGTDNWWPSSSGPANVTVQGGGGINLNAISRTVPSSGTTGTFKLVTGSNAVQGTALTLNGTVQIDGGNFQSTPTYGASSTLIYNVGTGVGYGVNNEWTGNNTTAGSGIPFNVTVQSGNITLPNSDRGAAGSATISAGSLILNGTSGDLYVAKNWTRAAAATFTPNNRAVFFVGSTAKTLTVTGGGTETFNYLILGGSNTLQLTTGTNLAVNTSGGLTLSSNNSTSTLDLNGQTFTVSGGGSTNLSAGTRRITSTLAGGTFTISSNNLSLTSGGTLILGDNVTTQLNQGFTFTNNQITVGGGTSGVLQINSGGFVSQPAYAVGSTLVYNNAAGYSVSNEWVAGTSTGNGVPNNVTVLQGTVVLPSTARTVPNTLTMTSGALTLTNGGDLTVTTSLVLNNSKITTNTAKVIIPASGTLTRGTGYVVGNLQKNITTGSNVGRTYEIGDATNYTPLSITFANVSVAGDVTATVAAVAHPNFSSSSLHQTKYAQRYWTLTNASTTFTTYDATFTYVSADLQGGASGGSLIVGRYASSAWTYPSISNSGSTTTATGLTAFGDFMLGENGCVNPTAYAVTGGGAFCSGGTGVTIGLSNSETGVDYQLILSAANNGSSVSGTNSAISFGLRTVAGTYTILGTRTTGGCSTTMTGNAVITVNPRPTVAISNKVNDACMTGAGSVRLTVTGGTPTYTITWTNGTAQSGTINASGGTLTVNNLSTASYPFLVTDSNGCTAPSIGNQ